VLVLDAKTGNVRGSVAVGSQPAELTFVPGRSHALVAKRLGTTIFPRPPWWTSTSRPSRAPAPIFVLPDASRGFLSPTFCEEGRASTGTQTWTNPDPASVVDLGEAGPKFVKNLPGFGPVVAEEQATRIVAYLDYHDC
jgi:hypothetical protein